MEKAELSFPLGIDFSNILKNSYLKEDEDIISNNVIDLSWTAFIYPLRLEPFNPNRIYIRRLLTINYYSGNILKTFNYSNKDIQASISPA